MARIRIPTITKETILLTLLVFASLLLIDSLLKIDSSIEDPVNDKGEYQKVAVSESIHTQRYENNPPNDGSDKKGDAALKKQPIKQTLKEIGPNPVVSEVSKTFDCIQYNKSRNYKGEILTFPICVYTKAEDQHVSGYIRDGRGWEVTYVKIILKRLGEPRSDIGLLDPGSHIGVYTLAAAAAGHHVVAVEPLPDNIARMRRSLRMGGTSDKVTIVKAAISNNKDERFMARSLDFKSGFSLVTKENCHSDSRIVCDVNKPVKVSTLDDLVPQIQFNNIVLKIHVHGSATEAFKSAVKLFKQKNVIFILMLWQKRLVVEKEVNEFNQYMKDKGFKATSDSGESLEDKPWTEWPFCILWEKSK